MTNKEKYKQAFSAVHISDEFSLESVKRNSKSAKKRRLKITKFHTGKMPKMQAFFSRIVGGTAANSGMSGRLDKNAGSTIDLSARRSAQMEMNMKNAKNKLKLNRLAACIAVCVISAGSATVAYAADIGGIQRTVQLWIHGDQTEATIEFDGNGSYKIDYTDSEGNTKHQGGGGVSIAQDGTSIPVTQEELMEELTAPDVCYEDDGTVFVYWFDQKVDITDKFENNVCYVKLVNGDEILYMTVKYQNGYATSPNKYLSPSEFN